MVKIVQKRNEDSQDIQTFIQSIHHAAREGCLLHQLYLDESIDESLFHAGLAFAKLYSLAMRSFGICNRVRTASQNWDQLYGITYDKFSNQKIEGLWRYILKALNPIYHEGIAMQEIAFSLVLVPPTKLHALSNIKKTLIYLQTIWEKIEDTPYQLGLYNCKKLSTNRTFH